MMSESRPVNSPERERSANDAGKSSPASAAPHPVIDKFGAPQSGSRNPWLSRILLTLILALSVFIQFTVASRSETDVPIRADAYLYFTYANNLKHYGVFSSQDTWSDPSLKVQGPVPDAVTTPGYPAFLLLVPGLEPSIDYIHRVRFVQAGLGVLSVLLVYLISRRFVGRGTSLAIALVTAINPHLATISTDMLTESVCLFLLMASVFASLVALGSQKTWLLVTAGILWAMCSLVRQTVVFLPGLLLLSAYAVPLMRRYKRPALILFVAFLIVQAPWQIRNQLIPKNTSRPSLMVNFLHHGSYPNFMYNNQPESYGFPYKFDPDSNRVASSLHNVLIDIAGRFRRQPITYLDWYLIGKPRKFLSWGTINGFGDIYQYPPITSPYLDDVRFQVLRLISLLLHWPLMLLGLAGAAVVWWRPRSLGLQDDATPAARMISAIVIFAVAFHMIGAPFPRYSLPFRPLIFMMALLLVSAPFRRRRISGSALTNP
jgi:4-amino-4-deoxy-L-arabinose transferase-like glycosyltransferase